VADARELAPGVWWWEAVHPEWTDADVETADWGPEVSSYALDDGERLVLIDPTDPPANVAALAAQRETVVVITCPWHERDARKLGVTLYAPPPDGPDDTREAERYAAGDTLPIGLTAFPGSEPIDLVLWSERHRALIAGDTLIDRGKGLEFPRDWAGRHGSADEILASLQPLLQLPVELVLPTHGAPADRAALERALAG
jgi:glyoxylase-like metal-dependent hydrolase (beta-lactamase superfamily II)